MEQLKITKYEQNCITLEIDDKEYYVFDAGSETSIDKLLASKKASATFVSHSHPDHFNIDNLKTLNCPIYGSKEVVEGLRMEKISSFELLPNKRVSVGQISVTTFLVDHGAISAPIVNFGFYIEVKGKSILYLGDIAIPSPIPNSNPDVVFIPVGGSKVLDVNQAFDFIKSISFKGMVIPMHFHGRADREAGKNFKATASNYCNVKVLDVFETISL